MNCRAAERASGGICEQALPRPGEDRQEPEERGADPGQNRGLEGGHRRGDGIFRCPCGVHAVLVSDSFKQMSAGVKTRQKTSQVCVLSPRVERISLGHIYKHWNQIL